MNDVETLVTNEMAGQNPADTDRTTRQIAEIYNLMKEKDVFLYKYWERLSKRINLIGYVSIDADLRLVEILKKTCQTNVLRRIAHLLQDYETSKIINEQYIQFHEGPVPVCRPNHSCE